MGEEDFDYMAPDEGGKIRVKIERYSVSEDVVNYFVTFYDMVMRSSWTCKSRYSELKSLHDALSH